MAVTQPTYSYTTQLNLNFEYNSGNQSFQMSVDPAQMAALSDAQLAESINTIMAQLRLLNPSGTISCNMQWRSEDGTSNVIDYNG